MSGYQTVVVGTDGSDSSLRAVERAAQIAAGPMRSWSWQPPTSRTPMISVQPTS